MNQPIDAVWFDNQIVVLSFARILVSCGLVETAQDVLSYFEKPWKWSDEYDRWVLLGEPLDIQDGEVLQPPLVVR